MSYQPLQIALRDAFQAHKVPYVYQQGRDVALVVSARHDRAAKCLRGNGEAHRCSSLAEARLLAARVRSLVVTFPHLGAGALGAAVEYLEAARRFRALRASRIRPRRRWGRG